MDSFFLFYLFIFPYLKASDFQMNHLKSKLTSFNKEFSHPLLNKYNIKMDRVEDRNKN